MLRNLETFNETFPTSGSRGDCRMTVLIPELPDGKLLLLARHRPGMDCWSFEFPLGSCDPHDESWLEPAAELLHQETQLRADRLRLLGAIHVSATLRIKPALVILASNCADPQGRLSNTEAARGRFMTPRLRELDRLIRHGQMACGITLAALSLYRASSPT